jgi:hypothetical protein
MTGAGIRDLDEGLIEPVVAGLLFGAFHGRADEGQYEFCLRVGLGPAGVLPDADGPGKPGIPARSAVATGGAASR